MCGETATGVSEPDLAHIRTWTQECIADEHGTHSSTFDNMTFPPNRYALFAGWMLANVLVMDMHLGFEAVVSEQPQSKRHSAPAASQGRYIRIEGDRRRKRVGTTTGEISRVPVANMSESGIHLSLGKDFTHCLSSFSTSSLVGWVEKSSKFCSDVRG